MATLEALHHAFPEYGDACGLLAEVYARQGRMAEAQALACAQQREEPRR